MYQLEVIIHGYFVEKCLIFRKYDQYSSMCCLDNGYDRDIIFALSKT